MGFDHSAVERPKKLLRGFTRITLAPGEEKEVSILCPLDKLAYYDPAEARFKLEHMVYPVYIGTSSDPGDLLEGSITL